MVLERKAGILESRRTGIGLLSMVRGERVMVPFIEGTLVLSDAIFGVPPLYMLTAIREIARPIRPDCFLYQKIRDTISPASGYKREVIATQIIWKEEINQEHKPWSGKVHWRESAGLVSAI